MRDNEVPLLALQTCPLAMLAASAAPGRHQPQTVTPVQLRGDFLSPFFDFFILFC